MYAQYESTYSNSCTSLCILFIRMSVRPVRTKPTLIKMHYRFVLLEYVLASTTRVLARSLIIIGHLLRTVSIICIIIYFLLVIWILIIVCIVSIVLVCSFRGLEVLEMAMTL